MITHSSDLSDAPAITLVAGDLKAIFLPSYGMLGASLRHKGEELLGRVKRLESAAEKRSTAGIPLLHPWANRLAGFRYNAAGREVILNRSSPFLHLDENGLPIHGVPWPLLCWQVIDREKNRLVARLDWSRPDMLAVFPFQHRLEMTASLTSEALTLETALFARGGCAVPVSFGFHPYLRLPGVCRAEWRLRVPSMGRLRLGTNHIPAGEEEPFGELDTKLGQLDFDDSFALRDERATFSIAGGGRRIAMDWLEGYRYAQIYAPKNSEFIALEPMTAPTNALISGLGLRLVEPGRAFRAVFKIRVQANSEPSG